MVKLIQLTAAASYASTSVLILIFNKMILTSYKFRYPFFMTMVHMIVGLIFLFLLRLTGRIRYASYDSGLARKAMPVVLCFVANCVLGMIGLHLTNIPMFATLRRLTVLFVILFEYVVLHQRPTSLIFTSIVVMVFGSLLGGWYDLEFDLMGYFIVLCNNIVTALNLVYIKKSIQDTKLATDTWGMLYYNSLLSIPFLAAFSVISGELPHIGAFPHLFEWKFQFAFFMSAVTSFLMNYSTFWCTEVNSPLTTSVTGQVKNVLSSFASLFFFGVSMNLHFLSGVTIGLIGSIMYAVAVYKKHQAKNAQADKLIKLSTIHEESHANDSNNTHSNNYHAINTSNSAHASLLINSQQMSASSSPTPSSSANSPASHISIHSGPYSDNDEEMQVIDHMRNKSINNSNINIKTSQ